ncbi:oxidoreductase [Staphylococcus hyicus]|uniref:2-dehydropantoate 2-reductase n=1 Tax=Staphylococcus hyicus TaxID=1284 RepID=A0A418JIE1_STAHY|nr:oxidoreductase [Staphylococcus hyicus]RIO45420.1 oxidoreductase [Staphylococcus hyicus]
MTTIGIIGPGAVGTGIAHALEDSAFLVDLLGKREETLTFYEYATKETFPITVKALNTTDMQYDWLIIAVKTTQLDAILSDVQRLIHPHTRIILAQNGYGQHEKIKHAYVYPAVVYISGQKEGTCITHFRDYRLKIQKDAHTEALQQKIAETQLTLDLEPHIERQIWYKLLVNLGINSVTALSRDTAIVLKSLSMSQLCRQLIEEGRKVAEAEGIHFDAHTVEEIMTIYAGYPDDMGTSMYYDVMNQRPLEVENIQGYILRQAQKHHIDIPYLTMAHTLLDYQHQKATTF